MPSLPELPLRNIHLPESISWWPLAFGWWLLLAGLLILFLVIGLFIHRYFKPTLKKEASKALDRIEKNFQENDDAAHCLSELSMFLRRAMLSHQKNSQNIAGITGEAWLQLLDQPLDKAEFSQGVGRILLIGPYLPQVDQQEVSALIQLCRKWVRAL